MRDDGLGYAKTFSVPGAVSLLAFAILAGCAAGPKAPAYLPDETRARLGTVGVASAQFVPRIDLQAPAEGGLAGAGRRAASWAGKAAGTVARAPVGGCGGGYGCGLVGIIWLAALVGSTVGGAVAGAVSGAVDALPPDMVREAEATLTQSLAALKLQEQVRDRVVQVARNKRRHPVRVLADAGPLSPEEQATYASAASHDIDSILEISVLTVGLTGDWDANPPLALTLGGRVRLVRVHDGTELHVAPMAYTSGVRTFTEWAGSDAQAFREELDRGLQYLAESVVEQTLLTTAELSAPAELKLPWAVVVGANGDLFIADTGNHRIRKVEPGTGVVTTVAGTGTPGFAGDGDVATGAQLANPGGVSVDANGDLFIADTGNHRIRKVETATGVMTTVAGTGQGGFAGDGDLAVRAQLASPGGVSVDANGNLFIADTGNHRIRKLESATGVITTVAGKGTPGFAGDGDVATDAQLYDPQNTAFDPHGDLLIVDKSNHCIRKIELDTGVIATVAGTGQSGFAGDGDVATGAQLASPVGIAVDANGDVFIADTWNHRIRKVALRTGTITTVVGGAAPMGEAGSEPTPTTTPAGQASEGNPLEAN